MATQCQGSWSAGTPHLPAMLWKETGGSPEFPGYPCRHMPRSKIPAVTLQLAITLQGLLSSTNCNNVDFHRLTGLSFRSATLHISGFNHAAYVLVSPLLRTPPLEDRTSVQLQIWGLTFDLSGFDCFSCNLTRWVTLTDFKGRRSLSQRPELRSARAIFC